MYGSVFTEDEVKKQLYESNRDYRGRQTWADLYSSAGTTAQQQMSQLNYDYANAMSQAYLSSLNSNSAIQGLNAIQGNKQMLLDQNSLALQQAFEAYSKQHIEGSQQIAQNLANTNATIDSALTEQANNTIDYANAHYDYLKSLYESYINGENKIFDNVLWNKFLVDEVDEDGNVIEQRLKTWNELASAAQDENGEWTSLYNDKNELTLAGADFFDQMENFVASTDIERAAGAKSWGEWLNETNPDLFKWATSTNPYDYVAGKGDNAGSFKTLVGMTSIDNEYTFAERYGGFTSGQLEGIFSNFVQAGKDYSDIAEKTGGGARNKRKAESIVQMSNDIKALTDQLGITDDIENDIGVSINDLVKGIEENHSNMKSGWELTGTFFDNLLTDTVTGAAGTATALGTVGSALGSLLTPVGTVAGGAAGAISGAVIGAIGGLVVGVIDGAIETRKAIKSNEQYEKEIERKYLDMVGVLISYANQPKELK